MSNKFVEWLRFRDVLLGDTANKTLSATMFPPSRVGVHLGNSSYSAAWSRSAYN
jgi:hypothetical protein